MERKTSDKIFKTSQETLKNRNVAQFLEQHLKIVTFPGSHWHASAWSEQCLSALWNSLKLFTSIFSTARTRQPLTFEHPPLSACPVRSTVVISSGPLSFSFKPRGCRASARNTLSSYRRCTTSKRIDGGAWLCEHKSPAPHRPLKYRPQRGFLVSGSCNGGCCDAIRRPSPKRAQSRKLLCKRQRPSGRSGHNCQESRRAC